MVHLQFIQQSLLKELEEYNNSGKLDMSVDLKDYPQFTTKPSQEKFLGILEPLLELNIKSIEGTAADEADGFVQGNTIFLARAFGFDPANLSDMNVLTFG